MGDDDALWPPGGSGRAELNRLRIVANLRRVNRSTNGEFVFIQPEAAFRAIEEQTFFEWYASDDLQSVRVALGINHGGNALCVLKDEGQGVGRQMRVDGNRNRADPHGAKHGLDELEAIPDKHADALAWLDP